MTDNLSERLKSLGVRLGVPSSPQGKPPQKRFPIHDVVDGEFKSTIFGDVFVIRKVIPLQNILNQPNLQNQSDGLDKIAECARVPRLTTSGLSRCLFLDTETSGLSGGTGTLAFLIGLGWIEMDQFVVLQIFLRDFSDEPAALAYLTQVAYPFEILITFNGKGFDLPLLAGRYIINSINNPFKEYEHLDLLPISRKIWRRRLDDRSLGNLEREILHIRRTGEEIPGFLVPQIYFDYLKSGDARPLKGVFYHNEMDVISMLGLLSHLENFFSSPGNDPEHNSIDITALGIVYEQRGDITKAVELYHQSIKIGLPEHHHIDTILRLATIAKRRKDWSPAVELWSEAASQGDISAMIELSKYYEHHGNDLINARLWAEKARELFTPMHHNHYQIRNLILEITNRIERIDHKLQNKKESTND